MDKNNLKREAEVEDPPARIKVKRYCTRQEKKERNKNHSETSTTPVQRVTFIQLPDCVLEKIMQMGHFSAHEVAMMRSVCTRLNEFGKRFLNRGYRVVQRYHGKCQEKMNLRYPFDKCTTWSFDAQSLLHEIGACFWILDVTFQMYIKTNQYCFIPGKIIDESFHLLTVIDRKVEDLRNRSEYLLCIIMALTFNQSNLEFLTFKAVRHFLDVVQPMNRNSILPPRIFISSSNPKFPLVFCCSMIGKLAIEDLGLYTSLCNYNKSNMIKLRALKNKFQYLEFKKNDGSNWSDQNFKAENILGHVIVGEDDKLFYLMKWKGTQEVSFISKMDCESKFPN